MICKYYLTIFNYILNLWFSFIIYNEILRIMVAKITRKFNLFSYVIRMQYISHANANLRDYRHLIWNINRKRLYYISNRWLRVQFAPRYSSSSFRVQIRLPSNFTLNRVRTGVTFYPRSSYILGMSQTYRFSLDFKNVNGILTASIFQNKVNYLNNI